MCGRFTDQITWSELHALYSIHDDAQRGKNTPPRFNICPTDTVTFVHQDAAGAEVYDEGRWGLIPAFFKEMKKGPPLINARIETVASLGVFRGAFARTRCLIPASGYYEWTIGGDGGKDPHWIHFPEAAPFSFAGIWANNTTLDIRSCCIITGPSEPPVSAIHDRQPLVLHSMDYAAWLNPATAPEELFAILDRHVNSEMQFHRVDRQVNSNRCQGGSEAIQPTAA